MLRVDDGVRFLISALEVMQHAIVLELYL